MRFTPLQPPRTFEVGFENKNIIMDCGRTELAPNEQLTFVTESGGEFDVTRKDWGFYATPSVNARLAGFGLRCVLVKNRADRFFVLLVEKGKEPLFQDYVAKERLRIVLWMDTTEALIHLEARLR
jgi:hypothetical protein